jgi:hypothetical protein
VVGQGAATRANERMTAAAPKQTARTIAATAASTTCSDIFICLRQPSYVFCGLSISYDLARLEKGFESRISHSTPFLLRDRLITDVEQFGYALTSQAQQCHILIKRKTSIR